jgi:hypothetical protein
MFIRQSQRCSDLYSALIIHDKQGETELAVATLQRLGEDVETCLKQLLFGTVRRSLQLQVAEDMRRYGYLGPYEWETLEKILIIEVHEICHLPFHFNVSGLILNFISEKNFFPSFLLERGCTLAVVSGELLLVGRRH